MKIFIYKYSEPYIGSYVRHIVAKDRATADKQAPKGACFEEELDIKAGLEFDVCIERCEL